MIDVRAQVASAPPAGGDAPGLIRAERINSRVFGGGNAGRLLKLRFLEAHGTVDAQGAKWVDRATILDRGPFEGRTISDVLEPARRQPVHPIVRERGTARQRDEEQLRNRLLDLDAEFQREHPTLPPTSPRYFAEFVRVHGEWARQHGLPTGKTQIIELRNSRQEGKPLTRRYNSGRRPKVLFDPDVLEQCAAVYRTKSMELTGEYSVFEWGRAEAKASGLVWAGSPERFRELVVGTKSRPGMVTRAERVMGVEGEWAHKARCMPKMKRPRGRMPTGKGGSLDGTPDDVFVKVRGRDGKLRASRLHVVGFSYYDSNVVILETSEHETAECTLRVLRRVFADDILDSMDTDRGGGFTNAVGRRRGAVAKAGCETVRRLTEFYGTTVDQKPPREAWLKSSESFWARKKRIDRLHPAYIGHAGEEKNEAWKRARENVDLLQTPAERAAEIQRLAELHNNTPMPVLDGLTPNEYHAKHRGVIRRPDPEELELRCTTFIGTRTVKPNGVVVDHLQYGAADEAVNALVGKTVYVWRPTGEKPPAVWLCDKDGHPLAIASAELDYATTEAVSHMKRLVARLTRRDRESRQDSLFLLQGRREQITEVIYRNRMREAAERAAHTGADQPPVLIVATADATAAKELKRDAERRAKRQTAGTSVGRTLSQLAEIGGPTGMTRTQRPGFVDEEVACATDGAAANSRASLWARMAEDDACSAEAG